MTSGTANRSKVSNSGWLIFFACALVGWTGFMALVPPRGYDFFVFYTAAFAPLNTLHDVDVFWAFKATLLPHDLHEISGAYVRPAIFALPLRVFRLFEPWTAFGIWYTVQLASYVLSLYLMARFLAVPVMHRLVWAFYLPVFFSALIGQDGNFVALILVTACVLLKRQKDTLGGAYGKSDIV